MASYATLRHGLAVRVAPGDWGGSADFNQLADSLLAAKRVLADIVGGAGIYAGGAQSLADLPGGTHYPAVTLLLDDESGNAWAQRKSAPTAIDFQVETAAAATLYAVPATLAATSPAALGGVGDLLFVALAAGEPAPPHALRLGGGAVTAGAFTSYTPASVAPGTPLLAEVGGGSGVALRHGSGAPDAGLGADGDWYLDSANGDLYGRASGTWSVVTNLVGPAGPAGAAGAQGPQGPQGEPGAGGSSGTLDNLTDVTISPAPVVGQALNLNGSEYVDHGHANWTDGQAHWGFAGWVKFNSIGSTGQFEVLGNFNAGGNRGGCLFLYNGSLYALLNHASGSTQVQFNTSFTTGVWYHLAVAKTVVGGAGKVRCWVNGAYDNQVAVSDALGSGTGAGAVLTGKGNAGGGDAVEAVDEVIWFRNQAWTDADAAADYNGGDGTWHTAGADLLVFHYDGSLDGGTIYGGSASYVTGTVATAGTEPGQGQYLGYDASSDTWQNMSLPVAAEPTPGRAPLAGDDGKLPSGWLPATPTTPWGLELPSVPSEVPPAGRTFVAWDGSNNRLAVWDGSQWHTLAADN